MRIKFCGAAGTVTGSCHLLEFDNGFRLLLDCGLYQGHDKDYISFNREWLFNPEDIDAMVLSHAHIDHCGRIPKLVRDGFKGDVICTSATRDLTAIMLLDSAFIQEQDAKYANKRNLNTPEVLPLYTVEDAKESIQQFIGTSYDRWYKINDNIEVCFKDAGHILGSASVTLRINENGKEQVLGFSGDIGRPARPILKDPQPLANLDYLICESTYGGKEHRDLPRDTGKLLDIIEETCIKKKGKLIIPAFSVGRTQEIVYMLDQLETAGKLPHIPVYVDSPLAINATEIFVAHPECYDRELLDYIIEDPNPFGFTNLYYIREASESKKLNDRSEPCIIISASGMMTGGRIRHHLKNNIEDKANTILVVGYCAPGTLGAHIRSRPQTARIFGQELRVNADIHIIDSLSGHADQGEILDFLEPLDRNRLKNIFLVHGERDRQALLREALMNEGFKNVVLPELGENVEL